MANTAYSKKFERELDPLQLLSLLDYKLDNSNLISNLPEEIRAFIRQDIICPCCKASNTEIVSDSISTNGKTSKRQPHFRFKDTSLGTKNGHNPFCDTLPSPKGTASTNNVFSSKRSRSRTTLYIRRLVCIARQINILSDVDIVNFRQWIFELKKDNFLKNRINEKQLINASVLRLKHGFIDNFPENINPDMHERFREHMKPNKDFFVATMHQNFTSSMLKKAASLEFYPDVKKYIKHYIMVRKLSDLLSDKIYYFKTKESKNIVEAFLALILYKNEWDIDKALNEIILLDKEQKFFEVDTSLGNITGSNPFQNIMIYEYLEKVNSSPISIPDNYEITYSIYNNKS